MTRTTLLTIAGIASAAALAADETIYYRVFNERSNAAYVHMTNGNYREAYDGYAVLVYDPATPDEIAARALEHAWQALNHLQRTAQLDDLLERAVAVHSNACPVQAKAAFIYLNIEHNGYLIAGKFERGWHRGGGRQVNARERDRVRAMQLLLQALALPATTNPSTRAELLDTLAGALQAFRERHAAWRLQELTDMAALPDYDEGSWYYWRWQEDTRGAPVDADGAPLLYAVPASFEMARNDGERWRWLLAEIARLDPSRVDEMHFRYAAFLQHQFDVHTISSYVDYDESSRTNETGIFAVHTLSDDETIARLASGVRRFTLPPDASFIRMFHTLADRASNHWGERALDALKQCYMNRRQYTTAVAMIQRSIAEYGDRPGKQRYLDDITGARGQFTSNTTQPAGHNTAVGFTFRNATNVVLAAHRINVKHLLDDVKRYFESNPKELDWRQLQIDHVGMRIVQQGASQYVGQCVAAWHQPLQPRPGHWDTHTTLVTPLREAGAYLLSATLEGGQTNMIVVWIDDTVIVQKPLQASMYYYFGDAAAGQPLTNLTVEFFGYRQQWLKEEDVNPRGRRMEILTRSFARHTDASGQIVIADQDAPDGYNWLVIATSPDGRFAHLGFNHIWFSQCYDSQYNQRKVFAITSQPVYRPDQTVTFKAWIRHVRYDQADSSSYAGTAFRVRIVDPNDICLFDQRITADMYGGVHGECRLPRSAALGIYRIEIESFGSGTFRVEEYKKPEFEVTIDAPAAPVRLGDTITAMINARYYFGSPVTHATVTYKVLRTPHTARWYPPAEWDWLYGPGYWWFGGEYAWYPGWRWWGCPRPHWPWWWHAPAPRPELVAHGAAPIGTNGSVTISIDTALAQALYGDQNHRYEITAEVTDASRRTITGNGAVLVARAPFQVTVWTDHGYYRAGDVIGISMNARTLDSKPVAARGTVRLLRITYTNSAPVETDVESWDVQTDADGIVRVQARAAQPGQYRLACALTDARGLRAEGGYLLTVMGDIVHGDSWRFNELELTPDKREYQPGDAARLLVSADKNNATVIFFARPVNGMYTSPRVLSLSGKTAIADVEITDKDIPNIFVEAFTINNGRVFTETREIIVPPPSRSLNVDLTPSKDAYQPGEQATVSLQVTDITGAPVKASLVLAVYDAALEYISGGANTGDIRAQFWRWRRQHNPQMQNSAERRSWNLVPPGARNTSPLGQYGLLYGGRVADYSLVASGVGGAYDAMSLRQRASSVAAPASMPAPSGVYELDASSGGEAFSASDAAKNEMTAAGEPPFTVRSAFADAAFWAPALETDESGAASATFIMPENLTGWRVKAWAMGHGTFVGEAACTIVTRKEFLLRMQAPRFFIERDHVVLSANVHNYLDHDARAEVRIELDGGQLALLGPAVTNVLVPARGEQRVDWRVRAVTEGSATVRMSARAGAHSDAMQMSFPVHVHGMEKMIPFTRSLRGNQRKMSFAFDIPRRLKPGTARLELRYSPSLAAAIVDALPYLMDYPYGCTEQSLNRFVPTVIAHKVLTDMGISLTALPRTNTNLNAQELGDPATRAAQWKRWDRAPVFDDALRAQMVQEGLRRMQVMQLSDGGWGWFSGARESASPHLTALVVHGLHVARSCGTALVPGVLEKGINWLAQYQEQQIEDLVMTNKWHADNMDALVYMALADEGVTNDAMRAFLFRDRTRLTVYGKAMFALALHTLQHTQELVMLLQNLDQYVVEDAENDTAWLTLDNGSYWWFWYGSEFEAQAYYLKLLARTDPRGERAARLAKYLLNNRKHATYWNSTRDTALCIEALAEYLRASGEAAPDMVVQIIVDGRPRKEVHIIKENLFSFDNVFVLDAAALAPGAHTVEVQRAGSGPLYCNAYLSYFSLEDFLTRAGLEIKVERRYYRLTPAEGRGSAPGARGQAVPQQRETWVREPLTNGCVLRSGELIEAELIIDSKNDYEYLIFEDMKPAGAEPVEVRSGYTDNELGAYVEFRDEKVCFFVRWLARGRHSVSYRLRAEIPGEFSALPVKGYAMYAPELRGNSDEYRMKIEE